MGDTLPFDSLRKFEKSDGSTSRFASIQALEEAGLCIIDDLPYTCLLYTSPSPRD